MRMSDCVLSLLTFGMLGEVSTFLYLLMAVADAVRLPGSPMPETALDFFER